MPTEPPTHDLERLRALPPREAVAELLRWWPSYDDVVESVGRYLPDDCRPARRGVYAWSSRGIPRARQTAFMRAVEDDFGVMIDWNFMESITQDRLQDEPAATTAGQPRRPGRPKRAA